MSGPELFPLAASDPPRIGGFWLDARVAARESGVGFLAHSTVPRADGRSDVILVQLNEGASRDAAARDRFAGVVNAQPIDDVVARGGQGQDTGRLGKKFTAESSETPAGATPLPAAPWVALAADGTDGPAALADDLLREVQLADVVPQGSPSGPDYALPWIQRVAPGLTRIWPLPWPGRFDRAGWRTILVSWLLTLLIAALGVFIATLIFHDEPPQQPQQPIPTDGSGSPQSGSPQSGEPSDTSSASPSEDPSASGEPSGDPSESGSGSPSPGEESSGPGAPTTRSRL